MRDDFFSQLPASLLSREGWSDLLDDQRASEPHLHQIEPTNHCPYTCRMCPRTTLMTRPLGFMDLDLYRKVMEEVAGFAEPVRSREIELFHFGESLLHPEIHEMVALASRLKLNATLSVNAPHLTPERADRILEGDPYRLIISFDGYDRESYMKIRGKAADYDKAVRHVDYLASLLKQGDISSRICIRMIHMYANEAYLDRFRARWEDQGFEVEIRPFFPWSEKELADLGKVRKYPPGMPCPFPWEYVVVQWDGSVVPCCRDYNGVNALGNVRESSLKEIWNSPVYAEFRRRHRTGEYGSNDFCRRCMEIYYTEPEIPGEDVPPVCRDCAVNPGGMRKRLEPGPGIAISPEEGTAVSESGDLRLTKPQRILLYLLKRSCCIGELKSRAGLAGEEFDKALADLEARGIVRQSKSAIPSDSTGIDRARPDTLMGLWDRATSMYQSSNLLYCDGDDSVFTYGEAREIVTALAAGMAAAGVKDGDRVMATGSQAPEVFLIFWATAYLGGVFVPVDPDVSGTEFRRLLSRIKPRITFVDFQHHDAMDDFPGMERVIFDDPDELAVDSPLRLANWMEAGVGRPVPACRRESGHPALILLTSGTTGESKGVEISHGALCRSAALVAGSYGWNMNDTLLSLGDFHTMSGFRNPCIAAVHAGASVVMARREVRANALVIADTVNRRRVTVVTTVPAVIGQFVRFGERIKADMLAGLRQVLCTASYLKPDDAAAFRQRFNVPVFNYYGLTETTGICAGVVPADHEVPGGTIGRPLGSLVMLDPIRESPEEKPDGGELLVWSENLMLGYLDGEERTRSAFDSGFYRTGDLASRDERGFLFLLGRKGDAIKNARGEFVHPRTIERILEREEMVLEAGVCGIGVGSEREELVAVVVPRDAVPDHRDFLFRLKRSILGELGHHRLPARLVLMERLPRGTNGKLLRRELKKRVEEDDERRRNQ